MPTRWMIWAVIAAGASVAAGQVQPMRLSMEPDVESVYAPPSPMTPEEGTNEGAVHVEVTVNYLTDYLYRGYEILPPPTGGDHPNLQFDEKLNFDLGKLPHPFIGVFSNVNDSDRLSRFQEIRPYVGADVLIAPFTFTGENVTYIYPNRDKLNTSEMLAQVAMNDSFLWNTAKPILSPYIYGAYDFNKYHGWYFELGMSHDFVIEDTGLTLTALGQVAYVYGQEFYRIGRLHDKGFQHYQFGCVATYSLNGLLNLPRRYGDWKLLGYLYYTDGIEHNMRATTQFWGGTGIGFSY